MNSLILLIALSISVLFQPSLGFAAEITPVKNHPMGCEYKLSGLIVDGDAEKIDKALKPNEPNDRFQREDRGWKICLDSPGGSFVEGVKLAKTFRRNRIGTVVAQNNVCESACAIAFLGGIVDPQSDEEGLYVDRTMHATAKLGFHAPALKIPEGNYSKDDVDKAYEIALKAVLELSKMRSGDYEISEALFEEILSTSYKKMHYIDTVGKALRYKINVSGITISTADVESIAGYICDNAVVVIEDKLWFQGDGNAFEFVTNNTLRSRGGYYEEGSYGCSIHIYDFQTNRGADRSFIVSFNDGLDGTYTRASTPLPPYASFQFDTLLASAFSAQSIPTSQFLAKARRTLKNSRVSADPKTCWITYRSAMITNVQNFTNLRRQAGLGGQVIGQVPLGTSVSVVNPDKFKMYDRCAAACNGTNQNAIKQCINNNDVWIEVEYNGRRGFLSRKFLE